MRSDSVLREPTLGERPHKKMSRAILEIIVELSAIFSYIWFLQSTNLLSLKISILAFCIGFPLLCIFREQKNLPEFSLDIYIFARSFNDLWRFTFSATLALLFVSLAFEQLTIDGYIPARLFEYIFWAFTQQIGLQTFLARRVEQLIPQRNRAALFTATLFALIHLPNLPLMILAWIGGFFWVRSYLAIPNLYSIALSHGWLAVLLRYSLPENWLRSLKIGPLY